MRSILTMAVAVALLGQTPVVLDQKLKWDAPTLNADGSPIERIIGYSVILTPPGEIEEVLTRTWVPAPDTELALEAVFEGQPEGLYEARVRVITMHRGLRLKSDFSEPVLLQLGDGTPDPVDPSGTQDPPAPGRPEEPEVVEETGGGFSITCR